MYIIGLEARKVIIVFLYQVGATPKKFEYIEFITEFVLFNFEPSNYIENEPDESKYFILYENTILAFNNENFIRPLSKDELNWSSIELEEKHFIGYLNNDPCFVIAALNQRCDLENSSFIDLRALPERWATAATPGILLSIIVAT